MEIDLLAGVEEDTRCSKYDSRAHCMSYSLTKLAKQQMYEDTEFE